MNTLWKEYRCFSVNPGGTVGFQRAKCTRIYVENLRLKCLHSMQSPKVTQCEATKVRLSLYITNA